MTNKDIDMIESLKSQGFVEAPKQGASVKGKSRTDWKRFDALKDEDIDTSDIPLMGADFFKNAMVRIPEAKTSVTIRLDSDVLQWFKAGGRGYQARINAVLRAYMEAMTR